MTASNYVEYIFNSSSR